MDRTMHAVCNCKNNTSRGFTIVELLIVIVVIGILVAITTVAYNGIQVRARDAQRRSDIAAFSKAIELYRVDTGNYPTSTTASTDATFLSELKPYMGNKIPTDPLNNGSYYYDYRYDVPWYIYNSTTGCKSGDYLSSGFWRLVVRFESGANNPYPVGSGAVPQDPTRCGTSKAAVSTATAAILFSVEIGRQ